jgi:hypothetical protein
MIMPGLQDSKGTVSWTRQCAVVKASKLQDEARKFQYFFGGKNKDGQYWTAKYLHAKYGLGFVYKSMANDPDIVKSEQIWGDPPLLAK